MCVLLRGTPHHASKRHTYLPLSLLAKAGLLSCVNGFTSVASLSFSLLPPFSTLSRKRIFSVASLLLSSQTWHTRLPPTLSCSWTRRVPSSATSPRKQCQRSSLRYTGTEHLFGLSCLCTSRSLSYTCSCWERVSSFFAQAIADGFLHRLQHSHFNVFDARLARRDARLYWRLLRDRIQSSF